MYGPRLHHPLRIYEHFKQPNCSNTCRSVLNFPALRIIPAMKRKISMSKAIAALTPGLCTLTATIRPFCRSLALYTFVKHYDYKACLDSSITTVTFHIKLSSSKNKNLKEPFHMKLSMALPNFREKWYLAKWCGRNRIQWNFWENFIYCHPKFLLYSVESDFIREWIYTVLQYWKFLQVWWWN